MVVFERLVVDVILFELGCVVFVDKCVFVLVVGVGVVRFVFKGVVLIENEDIFGLMRLFVCLFC